MLDERALSERLGVSRTPIREAIAMLEQDGFVKTVPRRGIMVVRKTKSEIVDMIRAWAALESMAARLITTTARKKDIRHCATSSRISARIACRRITSRNIRKPISLSTKR
jgi:DNA-binding GntR family transcriptional regulator